MFHCFFLHWYSQHILGPLQVHWFWRPIQEIKTLTFEQDGEILMLDVTCWNLIQCWIFKLGMPMGAQTLIILSLNLHSMKELGVYYCKSARKNLVGKVMWQSKFPKLFWIYFVENWSWKVWNHVHKFIGHNPDSFCDHRTFIQPIMEGSMLEPWRGLPYIGCGGVVACKIPNLPHHFCQICELKYFDQMVWKLHSIWVYSIIL